jgi:TfoX/Sxy family transcriptional regulator of competence genes
MSYDEGMAQRLREALAHRTDVVEKRMFGGIAFMLSGHMCCGVVDDTLMARVGPGQYQEALALPHAREMDFTGRPMRGFVFVDAEGLESDEELAGWVRRCQDYVDRLPPK